MTLDLLYLLITRYRFANLGVSGVIKICADRSAEVATVRKKLSRVAKSTSYSVSSPINLQALPQRGPREDLRCSQGCRQGYPAR